MLKRTLLTMILTILLAACGQSIDDTAKTEETPADKPNTEAAADPSDTKKDSETDSLEERSEQTEKTAAETKAAKLSGDKDDFDSLADLKVHYIDAGQADATLFQYKDENSSYTILYDTGDWNKNDVVNYLEAQNITSIDLVAVSHPHADHIGQLARVLEAYDVGEVWMNGAETSTRTFQQAMEAILASDADYIEPSAGDEMEIGPMDIEVLHPGSLSGDLNKDSLSLRFSYGDVSFVFTGDAYKADELAMLKRMKIIQSTVLHLGHHGSNTSSDPAFVQAVDPEIAIYSAGEGNSYGHPHPDVVSLVKNAGIALYGTDVHGTIIITTDGKVFEVGTKKDGMISPENTEHAGKTTNQEAKEDRKTPEQSDASGNCININEASAEKLQKIIHIGPARSQDVIEQRPYHMVDDLTRVHGIGPARIADIKNEGLACTGGEDE